MGKRPPPWVSRAKTLGRYVDLRQYPGVLEGRPTKSAKDKLRRHYNDLARYLEQHPQAYVYRPKTIERAREVQRLVHPERRDVLPRMKSLKVAIIPDVGPGKVTRIRTKGRQVIVDRMVAGKRRSSRIVNLTWSQKLAIADDPTKAGRIIGELRPGQWVRINTASGAQVGTGKDPGFDWEYEDLDGLADALTDMDTDSEELQVWLSGFTIVG